MKTMGGDGGKEGGRVECGNDETKMGGRQWVVRLGRKEAPRGE